MSNYKKTIGIEVHVELKTKEKLFSPTKNLYGEMANLNTNIIDFGYPGVLPTLNSEAIDLARSVMHRERQYKIHFETFC